MTDGKETSIQEEIAQLQADIVREKRLLVLSKAKTQRLRMRLEMAQERNKTLGQSMADDARQDSAWKLQSREAFMNGLRRGPGPAVAVTALLLGSSRTPSRSS